MNVVDSSAWLEYFADGPNAAFFADAIEDTDQLIVPSLILYEVFKRVLLQRDETSALHAVAIMQQSRVIDIDARIAIEAARVSIEKKLPMADSLIWATAQALGAVVWTQDSDFRDLPNVQYREAQR